MPLIVCWPGHVPQGVRESDPVSIADVPATVVQTLGLSAAPFPGASLLDRLSSEGVDAPRPIYFEVERNRFAQVRMTPASDGDMHGLVLGDMFFIRNADGREEVYNIRTDPAQRSNLRNTRLGEMVAERSLRLIDESQRAGQREVN